MWGGNKKYMGKSICVTTTGKKKDTEDTWQMDVWLIHLQSLTSHFHTLSKHIKNVSVSKWWTFCVRVKLGKTVMQSYKFLTHLCPDRVLISPCHPGRCPVTRPPKMATFGNAISPLRASYWLSSWFLNSEVGLGLIRCERAFALLTTGDKTQCRGSTAVQLLVCH